MTSCAEGKDEKIGIEVVISAKKDLETGLDRLIVACRNARIMGDIGKKSREKLGKKKTNTICFKFLDETV